MPPPPPERLWGRNRTWIHVYNDDVLSMPDKWEYPWFAAWDLAFHTIPFALIDPDFAKQQLSLVVARVVRIAQRPVAGLRMGIQRRQSAGASLGLLARVQNRSKKLTGQAGLRSSWKRRSTSC